MSANTENEYGTCDVCNQPFKYSDDFVRVQLVRNYQSQGYPDQFIRSQFQCHQPCLFDVPNIMGFFAIDMAKRGVQ